MPLIPKRGENRRKTRERLRLVTARHKIYLWPADDSRQEALSGFGFVADFSDEGVGLYLNQRLRLGTPLRLAFEDAEAVTYRGSVIWTERLGLQQKFIGHDAFRYRIGVKYLFGSEAERQRYLTYLADVHKRVQIIQFGI